MSKVIHLRRGEDYDLLDTYRDGWRRESALLRPVPIWLPDNEGGWYQHCLEAGFVTDWGSVPEFADSLFGIETREGSISYLNHDACYQYGLLSRARSDMLMWSNLKYDGAGVLERNIVFLAVRLFGARNYNSEPLEKS